MLALPKAVHQCSGKGCVLVLEKVWGASRGRSILTALGAQLRRVVTVKMRNISALCVMENMACFGKMMGDQGLGGRDQESVKTTNNRLLIAGSQLVSFMIAKLKGLVKCLLTYLYCSWVDIARIPC